MSRILVVDDEPDVLKMLKARLQANQFDVVTAMSAVEALEKLKGQGFDLIILDVMMPDISGYELCYTIKFDTPYKETPILFLTARDQEMDPRINKEIGADYLQKPYDDAVLLAKIKKLLKKKQKTE